MQNNIFLSIRELVSNPSANGQLYFGHKQLFLLKNTVSILRQKKLASQLMTVGLLPKSLLIGVQGIGHGSKNDPTFLDLQFDQKQFFTHIRIHQFDGRTVLGNRNFNPSLIGENIQNSRVNIITGVCLFGSGSAVGITDKGKEISLTFPADIEKATVDKLGVIKTISINKPPHLYEVDTILRISDFINTLTINAVVYLHIPKIEYYTYALDLYKKGLIKKEQISQWFEEVDKRANYISNFLDSKIKDKKKIFISPLVSAEEYIKSTLNPHIEVIKKILSKDPLWEILLSEVTVSSLADIRNLNYIYPYILLSNNSTLLAVENPEENGIMIRLQKNNLIKIAGKRNIIGLYPHTRVIIKDGHEEECAKYLYLFSNKMCSATDALAEVMIINQNYK